MTRVPVPVDLLELGQPVPVDLLSDTGQLLLRRGNPIVSEAHRAKLHQFKACTGASDGVAWQNAYARAVHAMLQSGADPQEIARMPMPAEIRESDYAEAAPVAGGWLDLQTVLRGLLYRGGLAITPLPRLRGLQERLLSLLQEDPDGSLFALFQALGDNSLGYCATHALLCAVVSNLTATRLGYGPVERQALLAAALTMNIGMAREQDSLSRQTSPLTAWQRTLIADHPRLSEATLRVLGVDDALHCDLVRWHHQPLSEQALPEGLPLRRLLHLCDLFVARTAARSTRSALAPVEAVRAMVFGAAGDDLGLGSALAQAVGFYPPGTYVRLANGEIAVSVQRGARANTPWVIGVVGSDAVPLNRYVCLSTAEPRTAIVRAVDFAQVRVQLQPDKVRKARQRIPSV